MSNYEIRPASVEEFAQAIEWAANEGWNPGREDLEAFHATDPNGFLMGWLDGTPIASISVARYGDDFGFLGFYIVHPNYRGSGYGMDIWNAGMDHLKGRVVGLDGVVDQQDNYRKSGFALAGRNIRYTGVPSGGKPSTLATTMCDTDLDAVCGYDAAFFPSQRDKFVSAWVSKNRTCKVIKKDGQITGYGAIRKCASGYKVGPLFANDADKALDIFAALLATLPADTEVSLDVPEANEAAVKIARGYGLSPSFETARMYRGNAPDLPLDNIFGITTFELG